MSALHTRPFILRLSYPLFVLVRDVCLAVMDCVADIRLVFEYGFHLLDRPSISLFFGRIGVNVCKSTVACVVEPARSWHLLFYELVRYARCPSAVKRHIENLLHDPLGVLVNDKGVFLFRVALVAERSISENTLTVSKLGVQRGLDLAAGIFRKPLISSLRIKHDKFTGQYAR